MKKIIVLSAFLLVLMLLFSITALAGSWEQAGPCWKYRSDDGTYLRNTWKWIDGNGDWEYECYFFNDRGYMIQDTITPDGYTVDGNGAWTENGIVQSRIQIDPEYMLCVLTDEMLTP